MLKLIHVSKKGHCTPINCTSCIHCWEVHGSINLMLVCSYIHSSMFLSSILLISVKCLCKASVDLDPNWVIHFVEGFFFYLDMIILACAWFKWKIIGIWHWWGHVFHAYCKISNMRHPKRQNLNFSHPSLQWSLRNILKPSVMRRMKM